MIGAVRLVTLVKLQSGRLLTKVRPMTLFIPGFTMKRCSITMAG